MDVARDLHYGDKSCFQHPNQSDKSNEFCDKFSTTDELAKEICESNEGCAYLENGQGMKYQTLAGPTFVVVYTFSGILMGYLADKSPRPQLLAIATVLFSISGALMGFAQEYWHLVLLRMGIAAGEAACRPASGSLIAEMFDTSTIGVANGIYSWGVYIGYGLTFTLGNYLPSIGGFQSWRLAFVIGCAPGLIIAFLLFLIKDPRKDIEPILGEVKITEYGSTKNSSSEKTRRRSLIIVKHEKKYFQTVLEALIQPTMIILFLATSIRHTAGYAWSYNTQNYLNEYYMDYNPGIWLTLCSIFGGSFGVFAGGWISDRLVTKFGLHSRLWLLSVSTIIAAPLAAGVLTIDPPKAFGFLMAYYIMAETWFAILFTVLVEIVPPQVRSVCIAIFLFLMNNIGGNLPVIVDPLTDMYNLRVALYIVWAGLVAASGVMFFLSSLPLWIKDSKKKKHQENK